MQRNNANVSGLPLSLVNDKANFARAYLVIDAVFGISDSLTPSLTTGTSQHYTVMTQLLMNRQKV